MGDAGSARVYKGGPISSVVIAPAAISISRDRSHVATPRLVNIDALLAPPGPAAAWRTGPNCLLLTPSAWRKPHRAAILGLSGLATGTCDD